MVRQGANAFALGGDNPWDVPTIPSMGDSRNHYVVPVEAPNGRYDVTIHRGLLASAGPRLAEMTPLRKTAVITDAHVAPLHLATVADSLARAGFAVTQVVVEAGEPHKTFADLQWIYDRLLEARVERKTPILTLGGGVVGDMGGFAAATLLRGLPFIQIPTTLLAMVDASVGGKTGINHPAGKNLIGAFHQPQAVWIDPDVLQTLPERELRSGMAECIKHDLIRDAEGFERLERQLPGGMESIDWAALVAHNVAIKAKVVESDPFENGDRAHLNFGHTFGHAIESVSNYAYSHGESVALGMVAAAHLSCRLGHLPSRDVQRMTQVIRQAGLPVDGVSLPIATMVDRMASDKKVRDGRLRFILLDGIGRAIVRNDISSELATWAFEAICTT